MIDEKAYYHVGKEVKVHGIGVRKGTGIYEVFKPYQPGEISQVFDSSETVIVTIVGKGKFLFHFSQVIGDT